MAGILLVILACFFWGVDSLIRYPLVEKGLSPVHIVFFEHIILNLIFIWGLLPALKRIGDLRIGDVFSFLVIGGLGSAISTVAFTESFQYLNPSLVIILQKFQPVFAILLAAIVLKEQIQKQFLIWAGICLFGGLLVSSPDISRFYDLLVSDYSLVISDGAVKGYGLVAVSVIGWAAATVFGKKLSLTGFDSKGIMAGRYFVGVLTLIPFITWNHSLFLSDSYDYVRILVMVLISGTLGMWFYYQGLQKISAKTTAIAEMFFPFFAIVANWIFLGKELSPVQLAGGGLLILGNLVIQIKKY